MNLNILMFAQYLLFLFYYNVDMKVFITSFIIVVLHYYYFNIG